MPTISVIVPIYRVEKYMDKCVASILAQTFTDLEVILVDDGSPDSCGEKCEEWAAKDARIVVVHKDNGGLSDARNAGLDIAKGSYVTFIDSDDYIEPTMMETMYHGITQSGAPMAACGINNVYGELLRPQCKERKEFLCSGEEAFAKLMVGNEIPASICNKMIKREVVGEQRFPVGRLYEDAFFTTELMPKIEQVWVTTEPLYYYVHRQRSITTESFHSKGMDVIRAYEKNMELVEKAYPALQPQAEFRLLWGHFVVLDRILEIKDFRKVPEYKEVITYLRKHWRQVLENPFFMKSRKIGMLALKMHVCLYKLLLVAKKRKEQLYD